MSQSTTVAIDTEPRKLEGSVIREETQSSTKQAVLDEKESEVNEETNKKTESKKRKKPDSSDDEPSKKKKKQVKKAVTRKKKKRVAILDDLTPQRKREINHIIRRAKKHDVITPSFITSALRSAKLASDKIDRIAEYKKTLEKQREHALEKGKDDEKKERIMAQFDRKLARLDRIKESFSKGSRVCLKAQDEVFLSKIKLPKPLSGYMLFAKESRDGIQAKNPDAGFGEIGRFIGTAWKTLEADKRTEWKTKAAAMGTPQ